MKPVLPAATGARKRSSSVSAYPPFPQLEENAACPLLMARSDPIADASLPAMRARRRPGIAIAAMMPMIATTISSSIRVKPLALRSFITHSQKKKSHHCQRCAGLFDAEFGSNRDATADQLDGIKQ